MGGVTCGLQHSNESKSYGKEEAVDVGAKRILLPMASVKVIPAIPGELFAKFQNGF